MLGRAGRAGGTDVKKKQWSTFLFIPALCVAAYVLVEAVFAMWLVCCTCCGV